MLSVITSHKARYFFLKRLNITVILAVLIGVVSQSASSHPHSWIVTKTMIEGDENAITGLKMEWTFDAMTSTYTLDGEDMSPLHKEETLQRVSDSIIKNMLNEHYFTYFYQGKTPIRYKEVTDSTLALVKGKLIFSFDLELDKPLELNTKDLNLSIYDHTYYIDMYWKNKKDVDLSESLKPYCKVDLIQPKPSSKQMTYAMSLPADANPDYELGQLFTQKVLLNCQ